MNQLLQSASIEDMISSGYADLSSHFNTDVELPYSIFYLPDGGSLHLDPDADDFGGPSVPAAKFSREKLYQAQLKKGAGARAHSIRREEAVETERRKSEPAPVIKIVFTKAQLDGGVRRAQEDRLSQPCKRAPSIIKVPTITAEQARSPALRVRFSV
jgi:hypothetical protein|mmetsp:Transcript_17904/g.26287  ORF Transcript_17904/g.26287 Transcript_17904/m.26287 type:complete len:157 (+) Transcript_17904:70-540(+)|eukprot:CAMPEP_0173128146 /NCGR_PEP_ID=MMETSP1102-20130122/58295_1 /TAXON_ID=49646 /ORGANISM="Geminigera sp., Strain Caron Lab Isolate" /LENGTH=156 /DNA_ID=CAMNT_0014038063 /DNA_START=56 /DNA_END=526 /DNA_ORIENTATION=+